MQDELHGRAVKVGIYLVIKAKRSRSRDLLILNLALSPFLVCIPDMYETNPPSLTSLQLSLPEEEIAGKGKK